MFRVVTHEVSRWLPTGWSFVLRALDVHHLPEPVVTCDGSGFLVNFGELWTEELMMHQRFSFTNVKSMVYDFWTTLNFDAVDFWWFTNVDLPMMIYQWILIYEWKSMIYQWIHQSSIDKSYGFWSAPIQQWIHWWIIFHRFSIVFQ